jgi:hypothetical protein
MNGHSTNAGPADGGRAVTAGSERTPAGPNAHPAVQAAYATYLDAWIDVANLPGVSECSAAQAAAAEEVAYRLYRAHRPRWCHSWVWLYLRASGRWVASTNRQVRHVGIRSLTVSGLSGGIPERQRLAAAAGATRPEAGGAGAAAGAWCW